MAMTARRTLVFGRWTGGVRRIVFRGVDLTAFTPRMQVRLTPDTPGLPLLDLPVTTNPDATGLRLLPVTLDDAVPVSTLLVQVLKGDLGTKLPPAATTGDNATFAWDLTLKLGNNIDQVVAGGGFVVAAGVTGADGAIAPVAGAPGAAYQNGGAGDVGLISIGDTVVQVSIEGIDLLAPVLADAKADGVKAAAAAAAAAASAALVRMEAQPVAGALEASADPSGRWSSRVLPDGSLQIQKLRDSAGRDVIALIDANGRFAATQAALNAFQPPVQIQRAKRALYDRGGRARQIMAADPITFTTGVANDPAPIVGQTLAKEDSRIMLLGGRHLVGVNFPSDRFMFQRNTTPNPNGRIGNVDGFEIVLVGNSFAWQSLATGTPPPRRFAVEIDGVATSAEGYAIPANNGSAYWHRVDLPASTQPRRIRVWTPNRPFGGIVVPAAARVLDPVATNPLTAVFFGDSITEGSIAAQTWRYWSVQLAYRLGVYNPIVSGVGSSGYIAVRKDSGGAGIDGYNAMQRIDDILMAVNGGPPDMAIIAMGLNDNDRPAADVQAAALAFLQALRTAAPDMLIIVIGPMPTYATYAGFANLGPTRDAVRAAAAQVARAPFVDVTDMVTIANRDTWYDRAVDPTHPVDAGHDGFAAYLAPLVSAAIRAAY